VRPLVGGEPLLVPMVKDAVRRVEPAARRIEIDLEFLGLPRGSAPAPERTPGGGRS
jgi:hypothetical protein